MSINQSPSINAHKSMYINKCPSINVHQSKPINQCLWITTNQCTSINVHQSMSINQGPSINAYEYPQINAHQSMSINQCTSINVHQSTHNSVCFASSSTEFRHQLKRCICFNSTPTLVQRRLPLLDYWILNRSPPIDSDRFTTTSLDWW